MRCAANEGCVSWQRRRCFALRARSSAPFLFRWSEPMSDADARSDGSEKHAPRGGHSTASPPKLGSPVRRRLVAAAGGAAIMTMIDPGIRAGAWAAGSDAPEKKELKVGFI